jgi:hypothetical protein
MVKQVPDNIPVPLTRRMMEDGLALFIACFYGAAGIHQRPNAFERTRFSR